MSVTEALFLFAGAAATAVYFYFSRKFATMTADELKARVEPEPSPADMQAMQRTAKVSMIFAPLPLLLCGYVAFSGILDQ
jgi:hypothetical protein